MNLVRKYFSSQDLEALAGAVRTAEEGTAGEVRVEVRQRRAKNERTLSIEQIARHEFTALGMTRTRERTGVLLFLLLEDKEFCILADEGIHAKVEEVTWTTIADTLTQHFAQGRFREGLTAAIDAVGAVLRKYVPRRPDDRNELSNNVVVR